MTTLELMAVIAMLGLLRLALGIRPLAGAGARTAAAASAVPGVAAPPAGAARPSSLQSVREYLDSMIVAGLVALFLISFVLRSFYIPSESMVPTLLVHDELIVNEFEYRLHPPRAGEIAVFTPPIPSTDDFIKRVIGTPGDRLRISGGVVYRNGVAVAEPYVNEKPNYELEIKDYAIVVDGRPLDPAAANIPPKAAWTSPDTIPPGCYLMLGDNRNLSEDSHYWGFAQTAGTFATGPEAGKPAGFAGHAALRFWPPNRVALLP